MINPSTISGHLSPTGAATDLAPLVEQLAKRVDTNRDGKVSSSEFSDFLTKLMQSIDSEHGQTADQTAAASGATAGSTSAGQTSASAPTSAAAAIRAVVAAVAKER